MSGCTATASSAAATTSTGKVWREAHIWALMRWHVALSLVVVVTVVVSAAVVVASSLSVVVELPWCRDTVVVVVRVALLKVGWRAAVLMFVIIHLPPNTLLNNMLHLLLQHHVIKINPRNNVRLSRLLLRRHRSLHIPRKPKRRVGRVVLRHRRRPQRLPHLIMPHIMTIRHTTIVHMRRRDPTVHLLRRRLHTARRRIRKNPRERRFRDLLTQHLKRRLRCRLNPSRHVLPAALGILAVLVDLVVAHLGV